MRVTWKPVRERQGKCHQVKDRKGCASFIQWFWEAFLPFWFPLKNQLQSMHRIGASGAWLLGAIGRGIPALPIQHLWPK